MNGKELYEYCRSNSNTSRYFSKDTMEPLWDQVKAMIRVDQQITAFELDIDSIAMYLWAELTANCRMNVSFGEALDVIVNHFLPTMESVFKTRIDELIDGDKEFAICCNGREAIMFYGNREIMKSAKAAFDSSGAAAFS